MTSAPVGEAAPLLRIDEHSAAAMLDDPTTSAAWLAEIAQHHPLLWDRVADHPSAYPHLIAWMRGHCAEIRDRLPEDRLAHWELIEQGILAAARRHTQLLDREPGRHGAEHHDAGATEHDADGRAAARSAALRGTARLRRPRASAVAAGGGIAALVVLLGIAAALATG